MAHHVKRIIRSITQKVLVELMAKPSSRDGQTLILPLCLLGRWARVLVIWPWTTVGVDGIGRRSWGWVMFLFLALSTSTTDTFCRRIAPSVTVEGSPHQRQTHVGKQEVRCHIYCGTASGVVNNDTKLGMRQIETESLHPHGERYLDPFVTIPHMLTST